MTKKAKCLLVIARTTQRVTALILLAWFALACKAGDAVTATAVIAALLAYPIIWAETEEVAHDAGTD